MINKEEFTKLAKRILHSRQGLRETKIANPKREWFYGVAITIVIVVASAVWSAEMYFKYQISSVDEGSVVNEPVVVYRESLVKAALEKFAQSKTNFDSLLGSRAVEVPEDIPVETDSSDLENTSSSTANQEVTTVLEEEKPAEAEQPATSEEEVLHEEESVDIIPTLLN